MGFASRNVIDLITLELNPFFVYRENVIDKSHHVTIKGSSSTLHHFVVNATIVDLDMKKDSLAHYRKYKKQYHESKQAYLSFMENHEIEIHD